jgi:hypothetical protein
VCPRAARRVIGNIFRSEIAVFHDKVFGWRSMVAGRRLAMNSVHGWFSDNKGWIEFIAAAVVLWLLMMTGVAVFDLRSAG